MKRSLQINTLAQFGHVDDVKCIINIDKYDVLDWEGDDAVFWIEFDYGLRKGDTIICQVSDLRNLADAIEKRAKAYAEKHKKNKNETD